MIARSFLESFAERYYADTIDVIDECNGVESAVRSIKKNQPDLVFLDVQMPDENGFELIKYFERISFEIIFTTAYKEYAIQAIRNSALDYLVKPINAEDFKVAISRYECKKETRISFDRFKLLTENINNQFADKQRIVFPTKGGFEIIQMNSIVYCKSDGSYSCIYTIDNNYFTSKSFKEVEAMLTYSNFIRVHRSYLVNKNFVKGFKSEEYKLELITGELVPVSDALLEKKELIDAFTS